MHSIPLRISLLCTGLLAGTATGVACTTEVKNEGHCNYNQGNETCRERYGSDLPYCGTVCLGRDGNPSSPNGDGCVDFRPEDGCYSPCGGDKDVTEDDMCTGVADTGTGPTSDTDPPDTSASDPTTSPSTTQTSNTMTSADATASEGPVGCDASSECSDASYPLCINNFCVACNESDNPDTSCADKDPELGVCGEDGSCVACTPEKADACTGTTPVCDAETSTCIGCVAHDDCGENACAFETGECLDGCHIEVDGDGGADTTNVQAAVNMVDDGEACTIVVHGSAAAPYVTTVLIDAGKRIAFLAAIGDEPTIQGSTGAGIELSGGAVLYADGIRVSNSGNEGITAAGVGTTVYLDRSRVALNVGGGVFVSSGARLYLRNSMVGGGGDAPALSVSGAQTDVVYGTILGSTGDSSALACSGTTTVTIRNSILASRADASFDIDCDGADISYSATEVAVPGTGNEAIGAMGATQTTSWFSGYSTGNFDLTAAGALIFADVAEWQTGDPATDIEGEPRPNVDGTADYAGADVP